MKSSLRGRMLVGLIGAGSLATACQILAGIDARSLGTGTGTTEEAGLVDASDAGDGATSEASVGCDGEQLQCGSSCIDPLKSMDNCGACGRACSTGGACVAGHCVRPFYISPNGSDTNDGASDARPWKTFTHALPLIRQGSGLVLLDGTYTPGTTGLFSADCAVESHNGVQGGPVVVAAANERMATLASDGSSSAISIKNCEWWVVRGLTATAADLPAFSLDGDTVRIDNVDNVEVWRLLVSGNNRYAHGSGIRLDSVRSLLLGDTEVYDQANAGFSSTDFSGRPTKVEIRGFYANSRDRADIDGGVATLPATSGDQGLQPGVATTFENAIIERFGVGFGSYTTSKLLGSIILNTTSNALDLRLGAPTLRDDVLFATPGSYAEGVALDFDSLTLFQAGGLTLKTTTGTVSNTLAFGGGGGGTGFSLLTPGSPLLVSSSNADLFVPSEPIDDDAGLYRACRNTAPTKIGGGPGDCIVYIPPGSNMKGAGAGGADIGANLIYRYENEVLTTKKLWRPDGRFSPCGAIVPSINGIAGSSCSNVHERLNFVPGGCPVP